MRGTLGERDTWYEGYLIKGILGVRYSLYCSTVRQKLEVM